MLKSLASPDEPLPGIVWDGAIDPAKLVDGEPLPEHRICVQQAGVDVFNADAANDFAQPRVDTAALDCALESLDPVMLELAS